MDESAQLLFAFLVGLTLAGLSGSAMELAFGRPVSLRMPFVSSERVLRSIGATLLAGPFMLANEALISWRGARIGLPSLVIFILITCLWAWRQAF
jgi:hypothetical protein